MLSIINETISNDFDFLGIKSAESEQQTIETMNTYEFQKEFLYDLFFNKHKFKIDASEAILRKQTKDDFNRGIFNIDYTTNIHYENNGTEFDLVIDFSGEEVDFFIKASEEDGREVLVIDWESINYEIYTPNGDIIDFHVFDRMEEKIERLFMREFLGYFIEKEIKE